MVEVGGSIPPVPTTKITCNLNFAVVRFAGDARRKVRRRICILQVTDNAADSVNLLIAGLRCNIIFNIKASRVLKAWMPFVVQAKYFL